MNLVIVKRVFVFPLEANVLMLNDVSGDEVRIHNSNYCEQKNLL